MRYREEFGWFACAGFDGEGCRTKVTFLETELILAGRPLDIGRSAHLGLVLAWESSRSLDGTGITIYGPDCAVPAGRNGEQG